MADGANYITILNAVGLRRAAWLNDQDRKEIKAAYKILYRSGLKLPEALSRLENEFTSPAVKYWIDFFRAPSKRGFCRFRSGGRHTDQSEAS
jgi:UDP-N-acetylglucosamine acyltransferase